jgi:predicted AlkP superfamily pyrophosphatase or phosphodiesterase
VSTREAVKNRKHFSLGEHGYDNDDSAMRALFVAHGPAFKSGMRVREFENVDVYPLVAHLLALPPRHVDGRYNDVSEMLVHPSPPSRGSPSPACGRALG